MGLRATVIRKYEVEYGNTQGFNYGAEELAAIIREFCEDYFIGDDGFGSYDMASFWEVDKKQFENMLNEIKGMSQKEFVERVRRFSVYEDQWNVDYIVKVFQGFLDETPEDSNYVRFGWL